MKRKPGSEEDGGSSANGISLFNAQEEGFEKPSKLACYAEERNQKPEYYFENGLRKDTDNFDSEAVLVYSQNLFKGTVDWRKLSEVFADEFKDQSPEYYHQAILVGKISVNNKKVTPDYIVRNEDLISHAMHRHEPPVTADPVRIVHQDENLLIVDKPASIPLEIVLTVSHSGILLIALTKPKAVELMNMMASREVNLKPAEPTKFVFIFNISGSLLPNDPLYCTDALGPRSWKKRAIMREPVVVPPTSEPAPSVDAPPVEAATAVSEIPVNTAIMAPTAVDGEFLDLTQFPCPEFKDLPAQLEVCVWEETYQTEHPEWAAEKFEEGDVVLRERFWKFGGRWDGRAFGNIVD
ncbi:hypothetical protein BC829DRAFT_414297 [Chytridium lagenaria]|nr:hypothetical protein BC829DRAFT_414297 [Chytridium lagenaria]